MPILTSKDVIERLDENNRLYLGLLSEQVGIINCSNPYVTPMSIGEMKLLEGFSRSHRFLATTVPVVALPQFAREAREIPSRYCFLKFTDAAALQTFLDRLPHGSGKVGPVVLQTPGENYLTDEEEDEELSGELTSINSHNGHGSPTTPTKARYSFEEIRRQMYTPEFRAGTIVGPSGRFLKSITQVVYETMNRQEHVDILPYKVYKPLLDAALAEEGYLPAQINEGSVLNTFQRYKSCFVTALANLRKMESLTETEEVELAIQAVEDPRFRRQLFLLVKHRYKIPKATQLFQQAEQLMVEGPPDP